MRRSGGRAVRRTGWTLVEMLVVIAILGLAAGVSGLALASLGAPRESVWVRAVQRARAEAVRTGRAVPVRGDSGPVLLLPDGQAVGPGLDPLTGAIRAAR